MMAVSGPASRRRAEGIAFFFVFKEHVTTMIYSAIVHSVGAGWGDCGFSKPDGSRDLREASELPIAA